MQIAAINMRYAYTTLLILIFSISIVSPIAIAESSTTINLGSYTTYAGSTVTVPVEISNATDIAGGSANISFNPSIVNVQELLPGDFGAPAANINNTAGFVSIATSSTTAVGKDPAELASIRFKGISKGITTLNITEAYLNYETGTDFTPTTADGEITVLAPPTPFFIYGYVFYENGSECHNPTVNVTNRNASNVWNAETKEGYNYYQLMLPHGIDINASEVLQFGVTSPDGSQSNITEHTVIQDEINNGGLFNFNITLVSPAAPVITKWYNNKTKNNSTEIIINESECVFFNATTDQPIDVWGWFVNDVNQSHNFDNFSYCGWTVNGTYHVKVNATNANGTSNTTTWTVTVNDITPPASITNLVNTTGNFWINWTWTDPADTDFNHTMVYINETFVKNVSATYYNATYTPHATKTISTHTVDVSGNINLSWVNQTATIPNNEPVLDSIGDKTVDEGLTVTIDANATDLDDDPLTYSRNRTDLFADFNCTTGIGSWTPSSGQAGTYYVNFGVSDGFGGIDNETMKIIVSDTTPPASITNLSYLNGTAWINWTWNNHPDANFDHTMVYINGIWKANTSNPFYMATELTTNTLYEIGTRTVDEVGNINATWVNGTAKTLPLPDTTPPASITNLSYLNGTAWINWTWRNPSDADFNYTMVYYLNGTWKTNTSYPFYNATDLDPDTCYEIGTHTVDTSGNINETWVNQTARTQAEISEKLVFDTGEGTYPSIFGTHNGTITPYVTIYNVSKLYTYSCPGTGGHSEYVAFYYQDGTEIANASWTGYAGDWHNISFDAPFTLEADVTYNYTIKTGSYPQIHHTDKLLTANGWINCTQFTDTNGKLYYDWIPAITFFW